MKDKHGFTLMEVLITVAIMTLLSLVLYVNMNNQDKDKQLANNETMLAANIQQARNYALSGYNAATSTIYGYGIYADLTTSPITYKIYVDGNGNHKYIESDTGDAIIDTFVFDSYGQINSCQIDSTSYTSCDIFFALYDGTVYAAGSSTFSDYTFSLVHPTDSSVVSMITIKQTTGVIE